MSSEAPVEPRVLPRPEHPVSRKAIASEALKVMYRLSGAGHRACLVGGSVRDLMLGRRPKDFDVATDAKPGEIRRLFRNSRVIGRRFRLVHVLFRDRIVEVSTFRREPDPEEQGGDSPDDLLITSDNAFGSPRQDAWRRDFTINALYYDISDFSIVDYVGGVEDLEGRTIRAIGDPWVRFREDPVRMMRACELAGRLGFRIDQSAQQAIQGLAEEIEKASPARLAEELVELLRCGRAGPSLQWMMELGLLESLLPEALAMIQVGERGLGDFGKLLPTLDRMIAAGREASDGALLAALVLPKVLLRRYDVEAVAGRSLRSSELRSLVEEVTAPYLERFSFSRERSRGAISALTGFLRLCEPKRTAAERVRVAGRDFFPDALFLFELLVEATGEGEEELAQWKAAASRRPVLAGAERTGSGGARDGKGMKIQRKRRGKRRRRRGRRSS